MLGSALYGADGAPLCPVRRAEARCAAELAEAVFGDGGPEARVSRLRESVGLTPAPRPLAGLEAHLADPA